MPPEKEMLFQLVNMLCMKTITYNIKNMLTSNMYSQNQNVQYHKVQITNIFLKGYPFSRTQDQFKTRICGLYDLEYGFLSNYNIGYPLCKELIAVRCTRRGRNILTRKTRQMS